MHKSHESLHASAHAANIVWGSFERKLIQKELLKHKNTFLIDHLKWTSSAVLKAAVVDSKQDRESVGLASEANKVKEHVKVETSFRQLPS